MKSQLCLQPDQEEAQTETILTTQWQSGLMSVGLEIREERYSTLVRCLQGETTHSVHQLSCVSQQSSITPSVVTLILHITFKISE